MLCLASGIATDRKVLLDNPEQFQFTPYFEPLPNPCRLNVSRILAQDVEHWPAGGTHSQLSLGRMSTSTGNLPLAEEYPLSVPKLLRDGILLATDNPSVWYLGQLVQFLTRPTNYLQGLLESKSREMAIGERDHPIAGIHVRRGDFSEMVAPQPIEKYMTIVEDYFRRLDIMGKAVRRRLYLATDDPNVHEVISRNYPEYTIFCSSSAEHAVQKFHGYYLNTPAISEIILDTFLLSKVDYFVGTLTSHVSKVVYMLRSAEDPHAEENMASLDSDFFIEAVLEPLTYKALASHNVSGELPFHFGSLISMKLEHSVKRQWPTIPIDTTGFPYGIEKRSRILGHFPLYKLSYAWEWMFAPPMLRNATNWYEEKVQEDSGSSQNSTSRATLFL